MSVLEVDPDTGDLVREAGSFVRLQNRTDAETMDEIAQGCRVALRLERGEVLLDQSRGVRYAGLVLEKGTPPARVEGELVDQLLRVAGVAAVTSIEVIPDYANRRADVEIELQGSAGDLRAKLPIQDRFTLDLGT